MDGCMEEWIHVWMDEWMDEFYGTAATNNKTVQWKVKCNSPSGDLEMDGWTMMGGWIDSFMAQHRIKYTKQA